MDNKFVKRRVFCFKKSYIIIFWCSFKGGRLGKFDDLFGFFIKEVVFVDVEGKFDYFVWFMEIFCIYF